MNYMTCEELKTILRKIYGPSKKIEVISFNKSHRACIFINDDLMDKWTFNKKTGLDYDSIRIINKNIKLWREIVKK